MRPPTPLHHPLFAYSFSEISGLEYSFSEFSLEKMSRCRKYRNMSYILFNYAVVTDNDSETGLAWRFS